MSLTSPLALGSDEDVERLLIENLLTASEERLFFKDDEGRYLMVSAGWLAARGCSLADVIGRTDFELFGEEYARDSRAAEQRVLTGGEASVAELGLFEGRPEATTRVPIRAGNGRVIGTFGTTCDVPRDPLTAPVDRVALMDRLERAVRSLAHRPGWVGVLFIDLDGFKRINDDSEASGQALVEAGRRLSAAVRTGDTVARLGGDEFVVVCSELRSGRCLSIVGTRVLEAMRAASMPFTASVGGASTADCKLDPAELLNRADLAMYAAKRAGGDRFALFDARVHVRVRKRALGQVPPEGAGTPLTAA